jgi:hypothetical protein
MGIGTGYAKGGRNHFVPLYDMGRKSLRPKAES